MESVKFDLNDKNGKFTAIIEIGENGWYVGQVAEMPEAISEGKSVDELIENLKDALRLVIKTKVEY